MRNPERIPEIMELIEKLWKKHPDTRFIQFVDYLQGEYSKRHNDCLTRKAYKKESFGSFEMEMPVCYYDGFNLEDDKFLEFLKEMVGKSNKRNFRFFGHEVNLDWHLGVKYDMSFNKDNANINARLYWMGEKSINSSSKNLCCITINGRKSFGIASPSLWEGEKKLIHMFEMDVPYNADGSVKIDIEAFFDMKVTLDSVYCNSKQITDSFVWRAV